MKKILLIITLFLIVSIPTFAEDTDNQITAEDPQIILNIYNSLNSIQRWIFALSTPAAIIGVGTGAIMKKFSFGDEERIIIGKKLIRNSLISYGLVVGSVLLLQAIRLLIGVGS